MSQSKWLELRIENEDEIQKIFADFFRTMGSQMGPSFSREARKGSFSVSSAIVDKTAETFRKGGLLFYVDVNTSPFWELDFDNDMVTVPVHIEVPQGLLDAINYFENEENRVVLPRYMTNQS